MKYLITNADDYGYRVQVSEGIIDCFKHGTLSSTSALMNFISSVEVDLVLQNPGLGLGIHLNLADGEPMSDNWRVKYGGFTHPKRNQNAVYDQSDWEQMFSKYSKDDIAIEFDTQLKHFLQIFKKLPTHADTHYLTSGISNVLPVFLDFAQEHKLPVRHPAIFKKLNKLESAEFTDSIIGMTAIHQKNLITTAYFFPESLILSVNPFEVVETELNKIKDEEVIEISFHPGYNEVWRENYNKILLDPRLGKILDKNNVELITYADIKNIRKPRFK